MALYIDRYDFTVQEVVDKINIILNNPQIFRVNTKRIADAFHVHGGGLIRAQQIIEYIVKYGRDIQKEHIISYDSQMNFIQRYSYDVIIFLFLIFFIIIKLILIMIRRLYRKRKQE